MLPCEIDRMDINTGIWIGIEEDAWNLREADGGHVGQGCGRLRQDDDDRMKVFFVFKDIGSVVGDLQLLIYQVQPQLVLLIP